MARIGILGGVGPETTAIFYLHIIASCQKNNNALYRPDLLIQNLPLPYLAEEQALLHGKNIEEFLPYLINYAQELENAAATYIVMPCNTLHYYENKIRENINIPFISIVDVVANFLKSRNIKKVGIIATKITLEKKFYQNKLSSMGIETIIPNEFEQVKIAKIIYGLVTGKYANNERQVLIEIINRFAEEEKLPLTLLACTDLQSLIPQHSKMEIVDTMSLLADEVVNLINQNI